MLKTSITPWRVVSEPMRCCSSSVNNNNTHLVALYPRQPRGGGTGTHLYPRQPRWGGTRTLRNYNPIHQLHCFQVAHKHSQPSLPSLPWYLQDVILGRTSGHSWAERNTQRTADKNLHFLHTRRILNLTRPAANHRCSLTTHISHRMTISTSSYNIWNYF